MNGSCIEMEGVVMFSLQCIKRKPLLFVTVNCNKNPFTNVHSIFVDTAMIRRLLKRISFEKLSKETSPHSAWFLRASMTVEASLVLPLLLFFFVNLATLFSALSLHNSIQMGLWNAGRELAVYDGTLESLDNSFLGQGVEMLGESVFVRQKIVTYLGEDYLEQSLLKLGKNSLICFLQPHEEDTNVIDIRVEYRIATKFPIPGFRDFLMGNRYVCYAWKGYNIPEQERIQKVFYVTKDSEVYHLRTTCTHLSLSIRRVNGPNYIQERENQGLAIRACTKCKNKQKTDWVYITKEGDCYHLDLGCSALKRTIYSISDTKGYRPCSRCSAGIVEEVNE